MINNILLTSKYGLHAERTTLWALRVFPSAARVQSTSVPLSRSVSKFCMSVLWWLFHLRQNCWSSSMVVLASFPRFCTDEKTDVSNVGCMSTNKKKTGQRTSTETCRWSRPPFLSLFSRFVSYYAIDRPSDPTLCRPPTTDYYRAHRAGRRTCESTSYDFCTVPDGPASSFLLP